MTAKIAISETVTSYTNPEAVSIYRLQWMVQGLKLEIKIPGMRLSRGVNCWVIAKKEFGLKGSRPKVLAALEVILKDALEKAEITKES